MKESLNGPVQANRSDGIKPGIGIERKNEPTFISVNMYITVLIKIIVYGNGTAKTILKTDRVIQ